MALLFLALALGLVRGHRARAAAEERRRLANERYRGVPPAPSRRFASARARAEEPAGRGR